MSRNWNSSYRHHRWTCFAILALISLVACSEDKTPPDEEVVALQKTANCAGDSGPFKACARQVLSSTGLNGSDRDRLERCEILDASSTTTMPDEFEAARNAVIANCH